MGKKENIKAARKAKKLTLEAVADYLGITKQTVQKYESGLISNIPSDNIEKMAELFDTTPAHLMAWDENEEKEFILNTILRLSKEIDTELLSQLLIKFNKLSDEDRNLALQLIGKMDRSDG